MGGAALGRSDALARDTKAPKTKTRMLAGNPNLKVLRVILPELEAFVMKVKHENRHGNNVWGKGNGVKKDQMYVAERRGASDGRTRPSFNRGPIFGGNPMIARRGGKLRKELAAETVARVATG
jgi:hypothetical protein